MVNMNLIFLQTTHVTIYYPFGYVCVQIENFHGTIDRLCGAFCTFHVFLVVPTLQSFDFRYIGWLWTESETDIKKIMCEICQIPYHIPEFKKKKENGHRNQSNKINLCHFNSGNVLKRLDCLKRIASCIILKCEMEQLNVTSNNRSNNLIKWDPIS